MRAISLLPECAGGGLGVEAGSSHAGAAPSPRSYLLLTAGAKEVLMAWRVAWVYTEGGGGGGDGGGGGGGWDLRTSLVASRGTLTKQGHLEWKKGCGSVSASMETDQRYMAVTGFFPPSPPVLKQQQQHDSHHPGAVPNPAGAGAGSGCLALAAMSDGGVTAMALEGGSGRRGGGGGWRLAASLRYHTRPVLSLAVTAISLGNTGGDGDGGGGAAPPAVIACSGATDGTIAVWDLTGLSASHAAATAAAAAHAAHAATAPPPPPFPFPLELKPATLIPASHQSGVNSIAVAPAPGGVPGRMLVASGGDDQALRVTLLSLTAASSSVVAGAGAGAGAGLEVAVAVARTMSVDFAHSSAIKGVWMMHGGVIATTSHDQRLRMWAARAEEAEEGKEEEEAGDGMRVVVTPVAGGFVECPEPEALDAWCGADGEVRVAVSGRGVQMFHLQ